MIRGEADPLYEERRRAYAAAGLNPRTLPAPGTAGHRELWLAGRHRNFCEVEREERDDG